MKKSKKLKDAFMEGLAKIKYSRSQLNIYDQQQRKIQK